jgi:hypothetical protein
MSGFARSGNDVLTVRNNTDDGQLNNFLYGDALSLSGSSRGGKHTLYAGTTAPGGTVSNDMWGDGVLLDGARGGRDQFVFKDDGLMTVGTQNTSKTSVRANMIRSSSSMWRACTHSTILSLPNLKLIPSLPQERIKLRSTTWAIRSRHTISYSPENESR